MIIGVIGNGFVGKATSQLKCKEIQLMAYDIDPDACEPLGIQFSDMNFCEIIFVSVPTPMNPDGSCHLDIVNKVLSDLKSIQYNGIIVLRSTVPPGTCDLLNVYFMPEFLTEKNYLNDFINNKDWIFGLKANTENTEFRNKISNLFITAQSNRRIKYDTLHFVTNKEAEMIKIFKNCFLATKVSFCNEMYKFCSSMDINYNNVQKLACNDNRITDTHSKVPGPDGKFGFGGTCFPKDVCSLIHEMHNKNVESPILDAITYRNEKIDRQEKDWYNNKGRSVV